MDEAAAHADAVIAQHGEGARQRLGGKAQFAGQEALLVGQAEARRLAVRRAMRQQIVRDALRRGVQPMLRSSAAAPLGVNLTVGVSPRFPVT